MKPSARISSSLCNGNMSGRIAYDERKKSKYALQNHITARPLSKRDFKVVKRVSAEQRARHIMVIERAEDNIKARWMPVLKLYLEDVTAAPPMQFKEVS